MVFTVGMKPDDSNNNGFPDTIRASVQLFSSQHPTALRQEGVFVFSMYEQGRSGGISGGGAKGSGGGALPMKTWRIEPGAPQRALANTLAGPSYLFQLSLLEIGDDRLPLDAADLVCHFEPTDGSTPVRSAGVRTIHIGRRPPSLGTGL